MKVGAFVCKARDVQRLVQAVRALAWLKRGKNVTVFVDKGHGASNEELKAVHLNHAGVKAMSAAISGSGAPLSAKMQAAIDETKAQWIPGLRVLSPACDGPLVQVLPTSASTERPAFRYVDIFAGIGGFSLALSKLGGQCVFASELDKEAQAVFQDNFGIAPCGDITEICEEDIPSFDLLTAGFPCQSFSRAGDRDGLDADNGQLFYEVVRLIKHHSPSAFLLENVANLMSIDNGDAFRVILQELKACGYHVTYSVVNARALVPQQRERIYIAGFRNEAHATAFTWPALPVLRRSLGDVLESEETALAQDCQLTEHQWGKIRDSKHFQANPEQKLASRAGAAATLMACYKRGYAQFTQFLECDAGAGRPRFFTAREMARIQGFPDYFTFQKNRNPNRTYHQVGNSVSPPVIAGIAAAIVTACGFGEPDGLAVIKDLLLQSCPEGLARESLQAQFSRYELASSDSELSPPTYRGRTKDMDVASLQVLLASNTPDDLRLGLHCLRGYVVPHVAGDEAVRNHCARLTGRKLLARVPELLSHDSEEIRAVALATLMWLLRGGKAIVEELQRSGLMDVLEAADVRGGTGDLWHTRLARCRDAIRDAAPRAMRD